MPVNVIQQPQQDYTSGAYTSEQYQRREEHKANTKHDNEDSYILALHTDVKHHKDMTSLREKYFPKKINKLEAHIALFRALPGSELPRICEDISAVVSERARFSIHAKTPFRMGKGVGIRVARAGPAKTIFDTLKEKWEPFLSQQDKSFRAHYTIQNKVDDNAVVESTLKEVGEQFRGSEGTVEGLTLYRYDRGYWKKERDFTFGRASNA